MVYIVGVDNHWYQMVGNTTTAPADALREYLHSFLSDTQVDLLAEELAEEHCGIGCVGFVCPDVANDFEIEHRFVDLDEQSQNDLGIRDNHDAREAYWLSEIDDVLDDDGDVLFICGRFHADRFHDLVISEGYDADVVCILEGD